MENVTDRLWELSDELKCIASLAATLETALTKRDCWSHEFAGASHIMSKMLNENIKKLDAAIRAGMIEG